MKVYSIGRGQDCDIIIADNSDVVSRHHASLTVYSSGKMCITDLSTNGTFVNGIKISPHVAVPVTRKDSISFAHVSKLDWRAVPKFTPLWVWIIIAVVAAVAVFFGITKVPNLLKKHTPDKPNVESVIIQQPDSTITLKKDSLEVKDSAKIDEPKKLDIDKKTDVKKAKKKAETDKDKSEKENVEKTEEKTDSTAQSRRAIG